MKGIKSLKVAVVFSVLAVMTLTSLAPSVHAEVWGVKSHDPASDPPTTLFSLGDNGQGLVVIGKVKLAGNDIDVDGLAQNAAGGLLGFQVADGAWSRLITINTVTAEATVVGATLTARDMLGAMFTADGRLFALDAANGLLVRIDPTTGSIIGAGLPLTVGEVPYHFSTFTDLTQRMDGSTVMVDAILGGSKFYDMDIDTGVLVLLHTDVVNAPDSVPADIAGIATSPYGDNPERLITYDVRWDDDIFCYDPTNMWTRSNGPLDIISSYNAGRGDLAGPVIPEPATLALLAVGGLAMMRRRRAGR